MRTLIIATRNRHKLEEIRAVLQDSFQFVTLRDLPGAPEIVEDAPSFAGNATKKSVGLARWLIDQHGQNSRNSALSKLGINPEAAWCLADDSGLEVDFLKGAPGVHSARFAALDSGGAGNSADEANNAKLLRLLSLVPLNQRTGRFRCVMALTPLGRPAASNRSPVCDLDELEIQTRLFDGTCEGVILTEPHGSHGFGYDPLFRPSGYDQTFAELGDTVKNRISHRAQALQKFLGAFPELK